MSTQNQLQATSVNFTEMLDRAYTDIVEGAVNDEQIIGALAISKMMEEALAEFKNKVTPYAMPAMERCTDKTIYETAIAVYKMTSTPTKYDYSISGDWKAAKAEEEQAAKKRKAIEKALRDADINEYVDKTSGEIISSRPAAISGGEKTISVAIKKN